jgi:hypothetical protein
VGVGNAAPEAIVDQILVVVQQPVRLRL